MKRQKNSINFHFTPEQQEQFNLIYSEAKKIHRHLITDDASKERLKVIIAYNVVNPANDNDNDNDNDKIEEPVELDLDEK
jgi:hypothetical protein